MGTLPPPIQGVMRGAWRENFMRQFKPNNHRGATVMTEGIPLVMTAITEGIPHRPAA